MQCVEPDDMYDSVLSERTGYFKRVQDRANNMYKEPDDMLKQAEEHGRSKAMSVLEEMKKRAEKCGEKRGEKAHKPAQGTGFFVFLNSRI